MNENIIDENGVLVGSWDDEFATKFFTNPENAKIKKIVINRGHAFQSFSWLSLLTVLEDFKISGVYDIVLDLSLIPSIEGQPLSICVQGSFKNIINWYNTSATSLSLLDIELSEFNSNDWAPTVKWGQKLKSFTAYYYLPLDFTNFEPRQLKSFDLESSAFGLESLADCHLERFGGDQDTWSSLLGAFENNPAKAPKIEEIHMVNGDFVGWGEALRWFEPKRLVSSDGTVSTLEQVLK